MSQGGPAEAAEGLSKAPLLHRKWADVQEDGSELLVSALEFSRATGYCNGGADPPKVWAHSLWPCATSIRLVLQLLGHPTSRWLRPPRRRWIQKTGQRPGNCYMHGHRLDRCPSAEAQERCRGSDSGGKSMRRHKRSARVRAKDGSSQGRPLLSVQKRGVLVNT